MSHIYGTVAENKARRLMAKTLGGGVAALSSFGGFIVFGELALDGASPWVAVPGFVLSATALIGGGITALLAYDRRTEVRKLRKEQQKTAVLLNRFPDESAFILDISSMYNGNIQPEPEKRIASIDAEQQLQMNKLYKILEKAHARAAVKFSEASARIERAKSMSELSDINSQYYKVKKLMNRIHEGYHYLTRRHLQSKHSELPSLDWRRAIKHITLGKGVKSALEVISLLYRYGKITKDDYDRLYIAITRLESQISLLPQWPTVQRQLVLDFELIEFEIQVYGSEIEIGEYFRESPLFLSNRPA